jgi:hypothetical protein
MTEEAFVGGDEAAGEDVAHVRRRLAARVGGCFERLEDAVSELVALHAIGADEIHASVQATIDREIRSSGESRSPES